MDYIHHMQYKHSTCAIWDEPIKRLSSTIVNEVANCGSTSYYGSSMAMDEKF